MSEHEILEIFYQILKGLEYLHSQKIIHSCIKPTYIFIDAQNKIKLCPECVDYNLLTRFHTCVASSLTIDYSYCAPELFRGCSSSFPIDIWSLGVVIYQLAMKNNPFAGENMIEISQKIENLIPPKIGDHFSSQFSNLVMSLLEKDPDSRPTIDIILKNPLFQEFR